MQNAEQMTVKPSNRQTVKPPAWRTPRRRGTVLMEAVLCLPLILLLVTGIWQFARIMEARFFTWLAAYNAARATLVYNNFDYAYRFYRNENRMEVDDEEHVCRLEEGKWIFRETSGVAWLAAVNTLAWISQTTSDDKDDWYDFPCYGTGKIPYSSLIRDQVRIVSELELLKPESLLTEDLRYSTETNGAVRVCVEFKLPLIFSIFDPSLVFGQDDDSLEAFRGVEEEDARVKGTGRLGKTFALRETVVLPKPYSTEAYPIVSVNERLHLLSADGLRNNLSALKGFWGGAEDFDNGGGEQ